MLLLLCSDHLYAHIPDLVNPDHLYHTVEQQHQQPQQQALGNVLEVEKTVLYKFCFFILQSINIPGNAAKWGYCSSYAG